MATAPILDDETDAESAPLLTLAQLAQSQGDISPLFDEQTLTSLGADVVRDYEKDLGDRSEWETQAREAIKRANQEKLDDAEIRKMPNWRRSFANFPILTVAAQQFNARAYPAICKSGEMVKVGVIGSDKGRPQLGPNGQPLMRPVPGQAPPAPPQPGEPPQAPPQPQMQPVWQIPPGAKQKRADRVADYMNVALEYRVDDWEEDTDLLLYQLPIIGCGFRKVWWAEGKLCAAYVSALDLVVPVNAKSLKTTPRITERMPNEYPYQISSKMASEEYRPVILPSTGEDDEQPRLLLEQHRYVDLDDDGIGEPYIITVDHETSQVLRIEAGFSPDDVKMKGEKVVRIERHPFYVKYPFLPNPSGMFYDIGFGHLLDQVGDIINTTINQMFDAGYAQIAGGGFIASGLRLQGSNQTNTMRWQPGEYKCVAGSGNDLRAGIVERTFPGISPVLFNLLEMMLGAAKDITSVKDVVTGDAPNTAPVGTTMALIEQGLQVFNAIYKRDYRSLGEEFELMYELFSKYGDEDTAEDYINILDDPLANFKQDFSEADMDIKPAADPSSVTRMQRIAKAQALLAFRGQGLNDLAINRRALEAIGIEDIDELMPDPQAPPNPLDVAKLRVASSTADLNEARAGAQQALATKTGVEVGHQLGESEGYAGGAAGLEKPPSNLVGTGGLGGPG